MKSIEHYVVLASAIDCCIRLAFCLRAERRFTTPNAAYRFHLGSQIVDLTLFGDRVPQRLAYLSDETVMYDARHALDHVEVHLA
jgi:hypothetical protein